MGWWWRISLLFSPVKLVRDVVHDLMLRKTQVFVNKKVQEMNDLNPDHKQCNLYRNYSRINPFIEYDDAMADQEFCPQFFPTHVGKVKATVAVKLGRHGRSLFAGRVFPPFGPLGAFKDVDITLDPVRDLETISQDLRRKVSAFLEIHDIAGLVRGAHQGEGLENNFLSHIRAVGGIFHILRAFKDVDIIHIDDTVDPVRNLETISQALRLKDVEFMERKIEDLEKSMKRSNDEQLKLEHEICLKVKAWVEEGKNVRLREWNASEVEVLNTLQLLTAKPVVYLVNMTEKDYQRKKNKFLPKIHAWVQEHGGEQLFPFSGAFERNLADMPEDEAARYCEENKVQSGITKIIETGYSAIILIYFSTAVPDEVKCWQMSLANKGLHSTQGIIYIYKS